MKILLIDPRGIELYKDSNTLNVVNKSEPIGLCYIGAAAKEKGHDVKIIHQIEETNKKIIEITKSFMPDIIGFSAMTYNYKNAIRLAKDIKKEILTTKEKVYIIFGGIHATTNINIVREKEIDFVVVGEGENTFLEIINYIENGKNCYGNVRGIAYLNYGKVIQTPPRPRLTKEQLNSLPFPLREGLPIKEGVYKRYGLSYPPPSKQIRASINASRGCKFHCSFCSSPQAWHGKWIHRDVKNIVNEMEILIDKYAVNYIEIRDENFTTDKRFVISLCREIIKRGIDINWYCQGRVSDVDREMLTEMKNAGCFEIEYGIESGDQNTLMKISKGIEIKHVKEAVNLSHKQNISVHGLFIIGFPWETKESLRHTKELIQELPFDRIRLAYYTPFNGTELEKELQKYPELYVSKDLNDFTSDIPVIRSKELTAEVLKEWQQNMYKEYYYSAEYLKRCNENVKKEPKIEKSYTEWFNYIDKQLAR